MKRDSFIFYRSFAKAIDELPDNEQLEIYRAIKEYALNGREIELAGIASGYFGLMKPQIDANNRRYKNGTKGGRPVKKQKPTDNQNETELEPNNNQEITKQIPNENGNENVNENGNGNDKSQPLLFLIKTKIKEQGFSLDDDQLIEHLIAETDSLTWFKGQHSFIDFIAQKIKAEYGYKPEGERHRIFRKLLFAAPNLLEAYPVWRKQQEKDDALRAAKEDVEVAREKHPTECGNCGAKLRPWDGAWVCYSCNALYTFDEGSREWKYHRPPPEDDLSAAFRKEIKRRQA